MNKVYFLLVVLIIMLILFFPLRLNEKEDGVYERVPLVEEDYPDHPSSLKDCENAQKKDFCLADVAEIEGNISVCWMIEPKDVRDFCRAKVSLNSSQCDNIKDEPLKEACYESIRMKKEWTSEGVNSSDWY